MAYMIPENIPRKATAGERTLFGTLKDHLPDDYIVYYEPDINGRRPDFVIIGPDLGLVVLEVKDYTVNTLYELYPDEWRIYSSAGTLETVKNPYKQARENAFHVVNLLKKDKNLVQLGGQFHGHLKFPYGFGAVFTRLKQTHVVKHQLHRLIPMNFMLTRDEIDPEDEAFSEEHLIEKILGMFTVFHRKVNILSDEDIQAIRYHLFPEVRISAEFKAPAYYQDQLLLSMHNIKAMDLHQESLAKQIGDKHRLIRGVAGSGKTLILASRAKMLLKENPGWKILVLCYAIPLSRSLRMIIDHMIDEPEDLFDFVSGEVKSQLHERRAQIEVYTFHEWLLKTLKIKDTDIPLIIGKLEQKEAILPTYDAILIDEGQDFEPEWLRLLTHVLNPDTQSLLLVEDRAQNIFKRKTSLAQHVGLDFRGRSKILNINYRNTAQIAQFAWNFYRSNSNLKDKVREGSVEGVEIIPPQATKRKGPEPIIKRCQSLNEEMEFMIRRIKELVEGNKVSFSDIAILYRVKKNYNTSYIDIIKKQLAHSKIPFYWVTENAASKREYNQTDNSVKISTIDSAKGLDFRAVFIVNIENLPFRREENEEREVSLFYIGMTRALEWLFLTYSGESKFTGYLDQVYGQMTKRQSGMTHVRGS